MRRVLLGSLLAVGLVFVGGLPSGASPGGGPACADIVTVGGSFTDATPSAKATVSPKMGLAADSCRGMTYTVYIYDVTGTTLLSSQEVRGSGSSTIEFDDTFVPTGVESVCVSVTSSAGAHIFDRAPVTGCVVVELSDDPNDWEWYP
jgi:hypothetical protein